MRFHACPFRCGSAFADSIVGANLCAAAAADALIRIDVIFVAGGDCSYRAYRLACSACDAVVANYVSHNSFIFLVVC